MIAFTRNTQVAHNKHVWIDRWEINVGDSLIDRIESAMKDASALVVILSKASVQSNWVKRELNVVLTREIRENCVLILPVLKEECNIPTFLLDKFYADFTRDQDRGFQALLEGVSRYSSNSQGRIESAKYNTDWGIDWGSYDGPGIPLFAVKVLMVEHGVDLPFTVATSYEFLLDTRESELYYKRERQDEGPYARLEMVSAVADKAAAGTNFTVTLDDAFEKVLPIIRMPGPFKRGTMTVTIRSRRLGEDTGRDIVVNVGNQLAQTRDHIRGTLPPKSQGVSEK